MALAEHDAAHGYQCGGRDAPFVGAKKRGHGHVSTSLDLAVGLDNDSVAQAVGYKDLLGFADAEFPRYPGVFDGG